MKIFVTIIRMVDIVCDYDLVKQQTQETLVIINSATRPRKISFENRKLLYES